jgi:hypothetical protein
MKAVFMLGRHILLMRARFEVKLTTRLPFQCGINLVGEAPSLPPFFSFDPAFGPHFFDFDCYWFARADVAVFVRALFIAL